MVLRYTTVSGAGDGEAVTETVTLTVSVRVTTPEVQLRVTQAVSAVAFGQMKPLR